MGFYVLNLEKKKGKGKGKGILQVPRYWNVPVLVYGNIFGVIVLPENVIFTFLGAAAVIKKFTILERKKWSSIVQYSCTSIRNFKYNFSKNKKKYLMF